MTDKTAPTAARSTIRTVRSRAFGGPQWMGSFGIPVARTFPLEQWREAMEISVSGKPSGKLLLLPNTP